MFFAKLGIIIIPAECLVWLLAGKKSSLCDVENDTGNCNMLAGAIQPLESAIPTETATDKVHRVMM